MNWQDDNIADTLGVGDWPLDKALTVIYNALAQSKNGSATVVDGRGSMVGLAPSNTLTTLS